MASYREARRTSIAWDHFKIKDREKFIATCNHCNDVFSYKSSVSNLMKHLRTQHGLVKVTLLDEDSDLVTETGEPFVIEEKRKKKVMKSEIWEYFSMKDAAEKESTCNLCLQQVSFKTARSALTDHLVEKHGIDCEKMSDNEDSEQESDEKVDTSLNGCNPDRRRSKTSAAWEFFEIIDHQNRVAACTICGTQCSYRSSVSNLLKHVRRKHGLGPTERERDKSDEEQEQLSTTNEPVAQESDEEPLSARILSEGKRAQRRSIIWLYFKCVDNYNKYSQCLICKKVLSHMSSLTNLKRHLNRKHPDLKIPEREDGRKRILLSSGGELFEVETGSKMDEDEHLDDDNDNQNDQTLEMNTVYLEDFDTLDPSPPKKKKHLKKSSRKEKILNESSSEDELTFFNKYAKKKSDSLDHFGKYLVSLLRKLPQDVSNKLQSSFVKQIMDASDVPPVTVTEQQYANSTST